MIRSDAIEYDERLRNAPYPNLTRIRVEKGTAVVLYDALGAVYESSISDKAGHEGEEIILNVEDKFFEYPIFGFFGGLEKVKGMSGVRNVAVGRNERGNPLYHINLVAPIILSPPHYGKYPNVIPLPNRDAPSDFAFASGEFIIGRQRIKDLLISEGKGTFGIYADLIDFWCDRSLAIRSCIVE